MCHVNYWSSSEIAVDPLNSETVPNVSIEFVSECLAVWLHLQEIRASHPSSADGVADGFLFSLVECAGSTVEAAAASDDFPTPVPYPSVQTETLETISRVRT